MGTQGRASHAAEGLHGAEARSVTARLARPTPQALEQATQIREMFQLHGNIQEEVEAAIAYFRDVELAVLDAARRGRSASFALSDVNRRWSAGGRRPPIDVPEMVQWISHDDRTLDSWPPRTGIVSEHGHFGGLQPYIEIAAAVILGVAGNVAYAGLIRFMQNLKGRITSRQSRNFTLSEADAIELAIRAIYMPIQKYRRIL